MKIMKYRRESIANLVEAIEEEEIGEIFGDGALTLNIDNVDLILNLDRRRWKKPMKKRTKTVVQQQENPFPFPKIPSFTVDHNISSVDDPTDRNSSDPPSLSLPWVSSIVMYNKNNKIESTGIGWKKKNPPPPPVKNMIFHYRQPCPFPFFGPFLPLNFYTF